MSLTTPAAELLHAWKPRLNEGGFVDVAHAYRLTNELTAVIAAMGVEPSVAQVAAGAVVNCQALPHFGLIGSHNADPHRASRALEAIEAWVDAAAVVRRAA